MEIPYPFPTLWINGRTVSLEKILHEKEIAHTPFEVNTFQFIREWSSGAEEFRLTTSGSTGEPKIIPVTKAQMVSSARKTFEKAQLRDITTGLVCIDTKYIGGKMMLARCLTLGLRIVAVEPSSNPLIKIPVDKCVQFTAVVPYQVTSILESKHPHLLNNLEKVLIGGAPLSHASAEQLDRFQCQFFETYGMTETISHIALRVVNGKMKQQYFETLPGVEISADDRGCLVVKADHLPGPVVTNDLADIVAPGRFLWLGRWDSVINTGGVKVMPEKIEKALETIFQKHNLANRYFIAALPDERLGNKVVLVMEGVQMSSELLNQSLTALKSVLSPFEFPKEVYSIPQFVMTPTQKIDRIQTLAGVTLVSSLK
ncbi:MAG: AMP-binding protein [Chryseosolibacter sp.]